MRHTIDGSCHCDNLRFALRTSVEPADIRARACDCRFCRIHGAMNWSDAKGDLDLRVADGRKLHRYRFALKTADFFICRVCGTYAGAVLFDGDKAWSTVNLRLTDLELEAATASFGGENEASRIQRRKEVWTPTRVHILQ
ncbi:MAG: hypothetical protein AAGD86_06510 [Pseudomonadota bacterium]